MNTKKILGIAAVTLLVAVALVGAGAAVEGDVTPGHTINPDNAAEFATTIGGTWNSETKTLTLENDVKLTDVIIIGNSSATSENPVVMTIDLNGHKIMPGTWNPRTSGESETFPICSDGLVSVMYNAKLTIKDSVGTGKITCRDVNNEPVTSIKTAVKVTNKGETTATWTEGPGEYGFNKHAELIINGGTLEGYFWGICGNGNRHGTIITVYDGTITGVYTGTTGEDLGDGIYHPQYGQLIVNGGSISGYATGIEIRAGYLEINGGTITSTCDDQSKFIWRSNGNGSTAIGTAVAVDQHTTDQYLIANITGGTLTGLAAFNEASTETGTHADKIAVYISGGNFISTVDEPFVYHHTAEKDYTILTIGMNDSGLFYNTNNVISGGNIQVRSAEELAWMLYSLDSTVVDKDVTFNVTHDITLEEFTDPDISGFSNPTLVNGVTLFINDGKTFTIPVGHTMTVSDGAKVTVGTTANGKAELVVKGILDATNGTLIVVSTDTVIVDGEIIAGSLNQVAAGSIKLNAGSNLTIVDENVTIADVNAKIQAGTQAGSTISIENTTTGKEETYVITAPVAEDGSVVTQKIEKEEGTVVSLNVESTYTFTVPPEIQLNTDSGSRKDSQITVSSTKKVSGQEIKVTIDTAAKDEGNRDVFALLGSITGGEATYKLAKDNAGSSYFTGNNGADNTVILLNLNQDLGSETTIHDTKHIYFETGTVPTSADTYTGLLTFKMEVTQPTVTLGGNGMTWKLGDTPVTEIYVPSGSVITFTISGDSANVTINGVTYTVASSVGTINGFNLDDAAVVTGTTPVTVDATLTAYHITSP